MKLKFTIIIIFILIVCLLLYYINYQQRDRVVLSSLINELEFEYKTVKIMTYNIQRGLGNDGIIDLNRIISIIKKSETHIIGLNEVDNNMIRSGLNDQAAKMAADLNMNYAYGPTLKTIIGNYGNALLTIFPVIKVKNHPLPVNFGREPRGVLEADLLLPGENLLKVLITHLSIYEDERLKQEEWINNYLQMLEGSFILMGDFNNEEINFVSLPELLHVTEKTYPSCKPQFAIDMFFTNYRVIGNSYTIKTEASDHLPLIIELPLSYNNR